MWNSKHVKNAAHRVIDHFGDGLWALVKTGQRREDDAAHLGDGSHVTQMGQIEWRFAHHKNQSATFFENHVSGACNQIV